MIEHLRRLLPGILLCVAITIVAILLQAVEIHFAGQAYLEALVLAILLGVAMRTAWTPAKRFVPGIAFSAKLLLEVAVVMLGASVSVATVLALGPILLVGIASVVAIALGSSFIICRGLGLPLRMAILIACGNSICGNSAIAAVAPVIGADGDDIAASISFTAVLGVVVVLTLPLLVPILQLSLTQYGVLAGLTVYAVPQVLAATLPIGALSNQVGTVIKLVRVLMLGPVVLGLSLLARDLRADPRLDRANRRRPDLHELVPWFITGFLAVLIVRSLGLIPQSAIAHHHPCRRDIDDHLDGGARFGRRCSRRGEERHAGDARGDGVADHSRPDQLRAHPPCRRILATPLFRPLQETLQRHGVVMGLVARRVEQRHRLAAWQLAQVRKRRPRRLLFELAAIGLDEFIPFCRVGMHHAAQPIARRQIAQPQIDVRLPLGDAARPQPVDQHAQAVVFAGGLVDPLYPKASDRLSRRGGFAW